MFLQAVEEMSRIANSTPTLASLNPPEPRFNYLQINISSVSNLAQHVSINSQVNVIFINEYLVVFF